MSHAWCLHHRKCRFIFCRFCWIIHRWCKAKRDECMVGCAKHDLSAGLWTLWSPFMIKTHDDRVDQVYIDHSESAFPREDKISTSIFFPKPTSCTGSSREAKEVSGAGRLRECKNTEFVFCEGGRKLSAYDGVRYESFYRIHCSYSALPRQNDQTSLL